MYQPKDTLRSSIDASDFNETIISKNKGGSEGSQGANDNLAGDNNKNHAGLELNDGYDDYLETEMVM